MKRFGIGLATAVFGFAMANAALAAPISVTNDNSFTYNSTAGMFEDVYDWFKYSPAYLPGLEKATLWTQLSNLTTTGDQIVDNSADPFYLVGGQANLLGGKLGAMVDWWGHSTPQTVTDYNSQSGKGFQESTQNDYRDTNGDGLYDYKAERYGRIKEIDNASIADLYLAYGLGGIADLDLGLAFRMDFAGANPTYDNNLSNPIIGGPMGASFDENLHNYVTDLQTGSRTYSLSQSGTGSLDYGTNVIRVLLGGRASHLIPQTDLIVNVGPVLSTAWNKLSYTLDRNEDRAPGASLASDIIDHVTVDGVSDGSKPLPGSGVGVETDVRADYTLVKDVILTGSLGFITAPRTIADAKHETNSTRQVRVPNGTLQETTLTNDSETYKFEGTHGDLDLNAKLRAQYYVSKTFKFGMGFNYRNQSVNDSYKTTYTLSGTERLSGTGSTATDYTSVTSEGYEQESHEKIVTDTYEFPVGMVIQIFDNLPIRFGAKHIIQAQEVTTDQKVTSRTPNTTQTTYADGSVDHTISNVANVTEESNESTVEVTHQTVLYHGATWWPTQNVQIDLTNIVGLSSWQDYRISITLHF